MIQRLLQMSKHGLGITKEQLSGGGKQQPLGPLPDEELGTDTPLQLGHGR
jgi:hypothetical protein